MKASHKNDAIGEVLARYDQGRDNLIPMLRDVQDRLSFLPPEAIESIAEYLGLSDNDVFGVATFYAQFRFHPPGEAPRESLPGDSVPCAGKWAHS